MARGARGRGGKRPRQRRLDNNAASHGPPTRAHQQANRPDPVYRPPLHLILKTDRTCNDVGKLGSAQPVSGRSEREWGRPAAAVAAVVFHFPKFSFPFPTLFGLRQGINDELTTRNDYKIEKKPAEVRPIQSIRQLSRAQIQKKKFFIQNRRDGTHRDRTARKRNVREKRRSMYIHSLREWGGLQCVVRLIYISSLDCPWLGLLW
ncbi:hypothetical protein GGS23DRAFT_93225 [Durotheca rogersii]|uniref:uncharacterized protein n=1 Tax=Durotheca rogersii TaxID=419775 RepID=UPI00222085C9|nr:uncharacterized protein GGS23DRAFT_93225 [Durotheca rogersii]KAI5862325.1 hypothetical protein GGS23DRAFT_93225 [Durotheca rogersii]